MKTTLGIFFALAAALLLPHTVNAQLANLSITCVARKADQKSVQGTKPEDSNLKREDWEYVVTIENKDFSEIANLQVKYIIFYNQEQLGSKAAARLGKQAGSFAIDKLKSHDKVVSKTDTVKLMMASLPPGYYYPNGAKSESEGNLVGLWVRIYQGDKMVAEMVRPPSLSSKEKWE